MNLEDAIQQDDYWERYHDCEFTKKEQQYMNLLMDGKPHSKEELIFDSRDSGSVPVHISSLRKKLEPLGETILCIYSFKKFKYQLVIMYYRRGRDKSCIFSKY